MEFFKETLAAYPFSICVIVMLTSEITKHINEGWRAGMWFKHGGMPSSHSAFVASLLFLMHVREGVQSSEFAIATVLAGIVWYDAAFVRSQVGKQAKALNLIQQFEEFSERVGHSVMEVVGGILFGVVVTHGLLKWIT